MLFHFLIWACKAPSDSSLWKWICFGILICFYLFRWEFWLCYFFIMFSHVCLLMFVLCFISKIKKESCIINSFTNHSFKNAKLKHTIVFSVWFCVPRPGLHLVACWLLSNTRRLFGETVNDLSILPEWDKLGFSFQTSKYKLNPKIPLCKWKTHVRVNDFLLLIFFPRNLSRGIALDLGRWAADSRKEMTNLSGTKHKNLPFS